MSATPAAGHAAVATRSGRLGRRYPMAAGRSALLAGAGVEQHGEIAAGDLTADDRFPYPNGGVIGVLVDAAALEVACERLQQAGFGPDRYAVLHGESGLARIDVTGEAHGQSGAIIRRLQGVFSDDAKHVRRYAEHLRAGQYVVGVAVGEDKAAKQRAADALRAADADFLNYYGKNYVEDLGAHG